MQIKILVSLRVWHHKCKR